MNLVALTDPRRPRQSTFSSRSVAPGAFGGVFGGPDPFADSSGFQTAEPAKPVKEKTAAELMMGKAMGGITLGPNAHAPAPAAPKAVGMAQLKGSAPAGPPAPMGGMGGGMGGMGGGMAGGMGGMGGGMPGGGMPGGMAGMGGGMMGGGMTGGGMLGGGMMGGGMGGGAAMMVCVGVTVAAVANEATRPTHAA